jgi:hypothetical protein
MLMPQPLRRPLLALLALGCVTVGCSDPVRPANVPAGATFVPFSQSGGWAHCWVDSSANVNRCRTYNIRGERLYRPFKENDDDDVFLRDEGVGVVPAEQLQIDSRNTTWVYVWLKNGVVLVPRNQFENVRAQVRSIKSMMRGSGRQ